MYKEYVVTAANLETTDSIWDDLVKDGFTSETIPERSVEVANERPINKKNTTYLLSKEEAELLKQDPRVIDVFDISQCDVRTSAFQEGDFNKNTTTTGAKQNWGLLRHILETNTFGTSVDDPGGTYDYVLDGTGVDVVFIDTGIQADHPEFKDAQGNSRVQQIDWFTASGVSGTMPSGFYTDYNGHGTHVAGIMAGKTFGWARNAHIYAIKLDGLQGGSDPNSGISDSDAFDCILGWHQAKTNGRPTILNNSWGYVIYWSGSTLGYGGGNSVTGGVYRGTPWSGSSKDTSKGLTGYELYSGTYVLPYAITSADADIEQLIDAGVIVCNASGNYSMKHDVLGGVDYDNYVTASGLSNYYYHRGGSPGCGSNPGMTVGSIGTNFVSSTEAKSTFSDTGPGVNIYTAGERIISSMSNTNDFYAYSSYYLDSNYKQHGLSGTSMASPQMAGMCALVKQVHPNWTPYQVMSWMINNAKNLLYSTGENNDYTVSASISGGAQKIAYMPMSGQLVYRISEV